jgi:hypothetical protein
MTYGQPFVGTVRTSVRGNLLLLSGALLSLQPTLVLCTSFCLCFCCVVYTVGLWSTVAQRGRFAFDAFQFGMASQGRTHIGL